MTLCNILQNTENRERIKSDFRYSSRSLSREAPPPLAIGRSHPSGGQSARLPPTPPRANGIPSRHATVSRKMSSNQASRRYWRQITAYLPRANLPIGHDFTAGKLSAASRESFVGRKEEVFGLPLLTFLFLFLTLLFYLLFCDAALFSFSIFFVRLSF